MINIRYHIVSITAVFLALGIGVALGSTFLDRATVDVLDRNIRNAENRIRETDDENARLRTEVERADARDDGLILAGPSELLDDHLVDVPVVVVVAPGVEEGDAAALTSTLERSGADLQATISLRERMLLDDRTDEGLATELGVTSSSSVALRREVYAQLSGALVEAGRPVDLPEDGEDPSDPDGDGTTPPEGGDAEDPIEGEADGGESTPGEANDPDAPDTAPSVEPPILAALAERDYLRIQRGPGVAEDAPLLTAPGHRYVFLGAPDITEQQSRALLALLPVDLTTTPLPAVVASASVPLEVSDDERAPGVIDLVRDDEGLAAAYSTVDHLDTFAGLVATVLVLEDLPGGTPAAFGQADDAIAILPPAP